MFNQYISPKGLLFILLEAPFIVLALLTGVWLRFLGDPAEFKSYIQAPEFTLQASLFVIMLQICFCYGDFYDVSTIRRRTEEMICMGQCLGVGSVLLGLMYFIFPSLLIGRGVFFISTALVATFIFITRIVFDKAWQAAALRQNLLILGARGIALTVAHELKRRSDLTVNVVGFLSPGSADPRPEDDLFGLPVLGSFDELQRVVEQHRVSRIVIALEDRRGALPVRDLVRLRVQGVRVVDAHSTISSLTGRIWLDMVHPSWFVFADGFRRSRTTLFLKRIIDLTFGSVGLVLSAPLMLVVAVAMKLDSAGPIVFSQTRVGFKGRPFQLLKFRSMYTDAEVSGPQWAQKNDGRITRVGRILRKFRLDELPQFINVIRGDMSFVGPRPERPVFVEQLRNVISYYDERHSVRPGLTGWAQVEFTYGASIEDAFRKLEYDLFYLKNMSQMFDLLIILKTIRIVLTAGGGR